MQPTLIARDAPRSERDPDLEATLTSAEGNAVKIHSVTGAFADPSHESAFAVQLFRMAYPCHTFLL